MRGSPITQILTVVGLFVLAYWAFMIWILVVLAALAAITLLLCWLATLLPSRGIPSTDLLPVTPPIVGPGTDPKILIMERALTSPPRLRNEFRELLEQRLWANTQIVRERIFGPADRIPVSAVDDPREMWAGYVGPDYRPGGLVLVANYPAGGTAPYARTSRAAGDAVFYELIRAFKRSDVGSRTAAFEALNRHVAKALPQWRMYKVIEVVLHGAGVTLDEIALINFVPYRIADNVSPNAKIIDAAWTACTGPTLAVLRPGKIAALGAGPGKALAARGVAPLYVFPRTIGDTYVHPKASAAAGQLSAGGTVSAATRASDPFAAPQPKSSTEPAKRGVGDLDFVRLKLGPKTPSTTSVHGKIRAVVTRHSGLSGAELLPHLREIHFNPTISAHTARGTPSDDWFMGYLKGGLRRGYLARG